MSMPIEETLPESVLNILSNYYLNNREQYGTHYSIQYRYYRTTGIFIEFFNDYEEQAQENLESLISPINGTRCKLIVRNDSTGEYYTAENFDYSTITCNDAAVSFYKTYQTTDNNSSNTASDFYNNNYLDYLHYNTLEIQPSPSPEPEEPNEDGTIESTTLLLLISAILMLIVMYRFIGSLFSRGD